RVNQVGGELDDIVKGEVHPLEHFAQVVEYLAELRIEVSFSDDAAVIANGQLTGNEDEFATSYPANVRVQALGRAGTRGVEILHLTAHGVSFMGALRVTASA